MENFLFSDPTPFGTWLDPDKGLRVMSSSIVPDQQKIDARFTGCGRSLTTRYKGAKSVGGSVQVAFWPTNIGYFLASWMRDVTVSQPDDVGSPNVYDHGFLFDDDADLLSLCFQQQYGPPFGSINILSAVVNTLTIKAAKKDLVWLTFEMPAKDAVRAGQNWAYSKTPIASPAEIDPTGLTHGVTPRPFVFKDAIVTVGGTPAITDGKILMTGGTAYNQVENLEPKVGMSVDTDAFGDTQDPTVQSLRPGDRVTTAAFDIDWRQASTDFYDAWMDSEAAALEFTLQSGIIENTYYYEAHAVLPLLDIGNAKPPDLSGSQARKIQKVEGAGVYGSDTVPHCFGLWLRTTDASYTS